MLGPVFSVVNQKNVPNKNDIKAQNKWTTKDLSTLDERRSRPDTGSMDDSPSVDLAVLGLLYESPRHGYELYRQYSRDTGLGVVWKVKRSHFYAILGRMSLRGLVAMEVFEQENFPPRKVYRLTEEGLRVFREWMTSPVTDSRSFRLDFPAKLFFARRIDRAAAGRLLAEQQALCARWLAEREAGLRKALARGGASDFDALVFRFRVGQIRAMSEWLSECGEGFAAEEALVKERAVDG